MEEKIERVRQYCLYQQDFGPADLSDEESDNYFIKKYPLINPEGLSSWKTMYFDIADAVIAINHPQSYDISGLLYNGVYFSDCNHMKLKEIYKVLSGNPLGIVNLV